MRNQLAKLQKYNSTKAERRVGEILKRHHVKFIAKARVGRHEVDFLIGKVAIEIDGAVHRYTDSAKDTFLFKQGLIPLHITTKGLSSNAIEKEILFLIKANNNAHRSIRAKKKMAMEDHKKS